MQHANAKRRERAVLAATIGLVLGPTAAFPQRAHAQDAAGLGEITVTARKREESLQSVPLVVDAYTREDIQRRGLQGLADVALATPGLQFESYNSGLSSPVIRGAAQQTLTSLEQNVSTFFDGIYLPRSYIADLGLVDVERVEVIKGPQTARYGRNAFTGAINYVPARPADDLQANATLTGGSDERFDGAAALGGPIVPGLLSGRISYGHTEFDGTWDNSSRFRRAPRPSTSGQIGGFERDQYSAALRFTPIEALTVDAAYYRFELEDEATPTYTFGAFNARSALVNNNCGVRTLAGPFAGEYRLYCGTLPVPSAVDVDPRSYGRQTTAEIARASVAWKVTEQFDVAYVYGRVEADNTQVGYSDANSTNCPFFIPGSCVFQNTPLGSLDQKSHELRIAFVQGTTFRAMLGAYRSDNDDTSIFTLGFLPPLTAEPNAPLSATAPPFTGAPTFTTTKDRSIFAEIGVGVLDGRLRFTAEARRGKETKDQRNSGRAFSREFRTTTPRFTIEYDLVPGSLVYASGAKGIRTGGFNTALGVSAPFVTFEPETNWTYELGSKNEFAGSRVIVNAALFYVDGKNQQISSSDPLNPNPTAQAIIRNLGAFTSKGAEASIAARPIEPLTVRLGVAYTNAQYATGTRDARYVGVCDGVVCPANGDIGGRQLQRQSPWSGSAGAEWRQPLPIGTNLELFVRGDVAYQDAQYVDSVNLAKIDSRTIAYATVGVGTEHYELRLWGRNLFDEKYASQAFFTPLAGSAAQGGATYTPVMGERRTYGATLAVRF